MVITTAHLLSASSFYYSVEKIIVAMIKDFKIKNLKTLTLNCKQETEKYMQREIITSSINL